MAPDSFWEVLADRIDRSAEEDGIPSSRRGWAVRQTGDPWLRVVLLGWAHQHERRPAPTDAPPPRDKHRAHRVPRRPTRPRRLLTDAQRAALDVLRQAGASTLSDDFSPTDLRSGYRRLALRWHPDRHATAAPDEHARLAETFARITDAYRRLAGECCRAA